MTVFDTLFQEAAPALLDQFGESVVYCPRNGRRRDITAIVVREPLQRHAELPKGIAPSVVIKALNHATTGILASEVDNGDVIEYEIRKGGTVEARHTSGTPIVKGGLTYIEVK